MMIFRKLSGDGLISLTSTGYSLSAGRLVNPSLQVADYSICPHLLYQRSVLDREDLVTVIVKANRQYLPYS